MLEEDFRSISRGLRERFQQVAARAAGHAGETGQAREVILRRFLAEVLPTRYSVGSGFIADRAGGRSRQIDVIVNDDNILRPFLYDNEKGLYLCESVSTFISVKSNLTKVELRNALQNVQTGKQRRPTIPDGTIRFQSPWESEHADIIPAFIFSFDAGSSLDRVKAWWLECVRELDIATEERADAVAVLNRGIIFDIPQGADSFGIAAGNEILHGLVGLETGEDTLLRFVAHLQFRMPKTIYAPPDIWSYLAPSRYRIF